MFSDSHELRSSSKAVILPTDNILLYINYGFEHVFTSVWWAHEIQVALYSQKKKL